MLVPGIPSNEAERIAVLRDMLILDTEPEERFDTVTAYCQIQIWRSDCAGNPCGLRQAVVQVGRRLAGYGNPAGNQFLWPRHPSG